MDNAIEPPHFPPEIWELVLRNCSLRDLKLARLVCRRWNDIVTGCPSLWRRFNVLFCRNRNIDSAPNVLPPAVRSATWVRDVEEVGDWWPHFGQTLEDLSFGYGNISIRTLFGLLKHCPKLKRLDLTKVTLTEGIEDDEFCLESMEELSAGRIFMGNEPVISGLNQFSLSVGNSELFVNCWASFIETVQDSLHTVKLPWEFVEKICFMKQLCLITAEFSVHNKPLDMELWIKFCRMQPLLQDLTMIETHISNEILCLTVQNLPSLQKLYTYLNSSHPITPTFLNIPSTLQKASIFGFEASFNFRTPLIPTLTELILGYSTIINGIEHLINSPNILILHLINCNLLECRVPSTTTPTSVLKVLRISRCEATPEMFAYMLAGHPALEAIDICEMPYVDKTTIVRLLAGCPKLRKVRTIECLRLAAVSGEDIMREYCSDQGMVENARDVDFIFE